MSSHFRSAMLRLSISHEFTSTFRVRANRCVTLGLRWLGCWLFCTCSPSPLIPLPSRERGFWRLFWTFHPLPLWIADQARNNGPGPSYWLEGSIHRAGLTTRQTNHRNPTVQPRLCLVHVPRQLVTRLMHGQGNPLHLRQLSMADISL